VAGGRPQGTHTVAGADMLETAVGCCPLSLAASKTQHDDIGLFYVQDISALLLKKLLVVG
jgi:hypothetical protein